MPIGTKVMNLGIGMAEFQAVGRGLFRFDRDKVGADAVGANIA
jgi:hypothetical protein